MHDQRPSSERSWAEKFRDAFHGVKEGVRGQSSFYFHFFMTTLMLVVAVMFRIDTVTEWCVLVLCITLVLTAEMFNSALEHMARAITREVDPHLGTALDIGSAAVLVASIGASSAGGIVFVNRLVMLLGGG